MNLVENRSESSNHALGELGWIRISCCTINFIFNWQTRLFCFIRRLYSEMAVSRPVLARDAFVRTNHRAIARMFVRLSGMGMHCDHTVHVSVDLSLWLDSLMFWAPPTPKHVTYSQPSFSSSTWKRGGI